MKRGKRIAIIIAIVVLLLAGGGLATAGTNRLSVKIIMLHRRKREIRKFHSSAYARWSIFSRCADDNWVAKRRKRI